MSGTPDEFHHFLLKLSAQGNDIIKIIRPDNQNTFVALYRCFVFKYFICQEKISKTYNKSAALLLFCLR